MTDPRLHVDALPRAIPPGRDLETPLLTLAWQATQHWSEEIERLRNDRLAALEGENEAWIALADECFRLQRVYAALLPALEQAGLTRAAHDLALVTRRLERALAVHHVEILAPVGAIYTPELSEVIENVGQVPQPDIAESMLREVLIPAIKRQNEIIRFGKAIIAVPDSADAGG